MSPQELATRQRHAEEEPLVISETEEGFRVYSPATPSKSYIVSGTPDEPTCTCPDFQAHAPDPEWRCKHILAVLPRVRVVPTGKTAPTGTDAAEERAAIQAEGRATKRKRTPRPTNGLASMLLKRSVSPDGRIDSLSVEISAPIERLEAEEIKSSALKTLAIQDRIVEEFRNGANGKETEPVEPQGSTDEAVPARLIDIGGMNGKWGHRLFITVEANGRKLRLFGSKSQLAEHITATGFPDRSQNIAEGVKLDIPCRIVTKPTEDGKYLNIEEVLPAAQPRTLRRVQP